MPGALQVQVIDKQQIVYTADFAGAVELGRQIDANESLYSSRLLEQPQWRGALSMLSDEQKRVSEEVLKTVGLSRAVVASLNEDTISRHHVLLEPLGNNRVRVGNVSSKVPIRLPDDRDLPAGKTVELDLPVALGIGRKTVRARTPDARPSKSILAVGGDTPDPRGSGANIRRLDQQSIAPGQMSIALTRFQTLTAAAGADNVQVEEMIRWLQNIVGVLQAATNSTDFFQRAAHAVAADKGVDIGPRPTRLRQFRQLLDVAAAQDDVIGHERMLEPGDDVEDVLLPFAAPRAFHAGRAYIILERFAFLVGQVAQLHGRDHAIDDERGAQAGAQPQKEHAAALVAAECLHGRVVDHLDRLSKRRPEVKPDPASAQIDRFHQNLLVDHWARVADADGVVLPTRRQLADAIHHFLRRQAVAGREFANLFLSIEPQLDVGAANVHYQNAHEKPRIG